MKRSTEIVIAGLFAFFLIFIMLVAFWSIFGNQVSMSNY